jgi:hypothetical protein
MEDTPSSWNTLPEELKHHTLSFVETYTPEYAAARLVCAEWSHSLKALPKRPLLFYDDIVQSSDSQNKSNPGRCIIYDEIVLEVDPLLDPRNRALPAWPPRLRRLSRRRRAKRQQMFETFGFDLMAALDEAKMDAPARAASSRPLTAADVN